MWSLWYVGTTYVDPGATATDNVDGNITSRLSTYGVGSVKTTAPTSVSSPYVITYDVTDSSGNAATPGLRYVIVACKSPTVECTASDGSLFCSTTAGLCIESTTTTTATAGTYPTIKLIGQALLGLTEGTPYLACPTPQPTNVICDRWPPQRIHPCAGCIDRNCVCIHLKNTHTVSADSALALYKARLALFCAAAECKHIPLLVFA